MMAAVSPVPGKPLLLLGAFDIGSVGYVAEEFFVSGTAASYAPVSGLGPTAVGWQHLRALPSTPRGSWL
ncbi:hypothetical protein I546_1351 [Mycobacterium kansasii 732]|nr:hypothetical protein I546_1351 [Mycobacterium kansasii 732]